MWNEPGGGFRDFSGMKAEVFCMIYSLQEMNLKGNSAVKGEFSFDVGGFLELHRIDEKIPAG